MTLFNNIYKGKTVLITGHAGFKGSWLSLWLTQLGAKVAGYSLIPDSEFSLYEELNIKNIIHDSLIADICDREKINFYFEKHKPEIVFHLAAQPLVRLSYSEPFETYETNVIGTLNVLEAARKCTSVKVFVNVTTDKCYENKEKNEGYTEDEPMGGYDMYSSSKACSELLTSSYRNSFLKNKESFLLASARAGNVIGGGDWAKDRLITDCMHALNNNETIYIRNPLATRPWQHVLEPLTGYLILAQHLYEKGQDFTQGYNFGPDVDLDVKVCEVAQKVVEIWGDGKVEVGSSDGLHEATLLQLNIEKAKKDLGFMPIWSAHEAIKFTTLWYKAFYAKKTDMLAFSYEQLNTFIDAAKVKNAKWCD